MSAIAGALEQRLEKLTLPLAVVLPGGQRIGPLDAAVTVRLKELLPLTHIVTGQIGKIGEDYVEGRMDIDGSMRDLMALGAELVPGDPSDTSAVGPTPIGWLRRLMHLARSRARHELEADARQIQFHYDVSDEFYALWLDPKRVYSCAYFRDAGMSIAKAQEAKIEHICRKLMLKEGERFLDVGAGWGGLLLWAAERYGVKARGITLSRNQHAHVNRLIDERGLRGKVEMDLLDYRALPEGEPFDKISSVGMFEHVGRAQLPGYFAKLYRLLKPGRPAAQPRYHRRRHAQPPARRWPGRLHGTLHLSGRRADARVARARGDDSSGSPGFTPGICGAASPSFWPLFSLGAFAHLHLDGDDGVADVLDDIGERRRIDRDHVIGGRGRLGGRLGERDTRQRKPTGDRTGQREDAGRAEQRRARGDPLAVGGLVVLEHARLRGTHRRTTRSPVMTPWRHQAYPRMSET